MDWSELLSKIRCRVFRNWKAAEDYYSNTLREAKFALAGEQRAEAEIEDDIDLEEALRVGTIMSTTQ